MSLVHSTEIKTFLQRYAFVFFLLFLCVLFFIIGALSVLGDSVTIDEVAHIISGYSMGKFGMLLFNPEHPPLLKYLAALPLLLNKTSYLLPQVESNQWNEGVKFLFYSSVHADTLLSSSRFAVLLFNTLILCFSGIYLRYLYGTHIALLCISVLAFDPTILAHARYVTTDVPVSFLILLTLLSFITLWRKYTALQGYILGVLLAVALLVKFSALFLWLYLFLFFLWQLLVKKKYTYMQAFPVVVIALTLVYLGYMLTSFATPGNVTRKMLEESLLPTQVKTILLPMTHTPFTNVFPEFFVGLSYAGNRTLQQGEVTGIQFLNGEFREQGRGWWYYFPSAFLVKATPSMLLGMLMALVGICILFWRKKKLQPEGMFLLGFALLYLAYSMYSSLNIGIRHIMPVLVLLPIGLVVLCQEGIRSKVWIAMLVLIAFQGYSLFSTYPYFLAYANDWSGGTAKLYTHLSDSNVDWGENLKRVSLWAKEQNVQTLYIDYWGKTPLHYYDEDKRLEPWGVDQGLPSGYLAVLSPWIAQSKYFFSQGKATKSYLELVGKKPVAVIGGIFIYDLRK